MIGVERGEPLRTDQPPSEPGRWQRFGLSDKRLLVGGGILLLIILAAIFAPVITVHDPIGLNLPEKLQGPSASHWFGTDRVGFDIFARVVYAARVDLFIAISAVALSVLIGMPLGVFVGYVGGKLEGVVMRGLDIFQAFPVLILAVGVLAALGPGQEKVIIVVAVVGVPTFVRLTRTEVQSLKERAYVEAGRAAGNSRRAILIRYIMPGTFGTVATQMAISCGWAIILTSSLGFLGLGVPIPNPEWGSMIASGVEGMVSGHWWLSVFPGLAIAVTVFSFTLLGEAASDLVDPRRRLPR